MDDTQILSLYFQRDEAAIKKTAEKYGSYLSCIAYNILHCHEDSEEVVEDTYFGAWNSIPPERPRVLKHYLSRITRNLAFNRLDYLTAKCRNPHMRMILSELDACIPDSNADLSIKMESIQIGECLNRFLSSLSKTDCTIFLCRYYHCMSISEISKKYGIHDRSVKYRLSKMRQGFRHELSKEGICV